MERSNTPRDDIAAGWLQRRESDGWNSVLEAELHAWLEESTANRVAFLRLEAAWDETGRLHVLAPGYPRRTVPTPEQLQLTPLLKHHPAPTPGVMSRHWARAPAVIAASIVIAVASVSAWLVWPAGDSYVTPIGGLASVPLKDGSSIALNTASKVRVRLSDTERRVELTRGEAYFDVANDPRRPFTVMAGESIVTAIGTAFSVRKNGREVRVVVAEGKVKVEDRSKPSRAPMYVAAGGVVRTEKETLTIEQKPVPRTEELLSWRTGYLVFRDTPLTSVIAEFNRYNDRKIEIAEPAIETIRLTGKFRTTNTDALIRLLQKSFQVSARETDGHIALIGEAASR
jgi:transmembrane sensor